MSGGLKLYVQELESLAEVVSLQPSIERAVASCLMLLLERPIANALIQKAKQLDFGLHRTYLPPLYRHPYFADLTVVNGEGVVLGSETDITKKQAHLTNSEKLHAHLLGIPFHRFLNEFDVSNVVEELSNWLR
jgi:dTDP-4-amino-4,6-dideoxygalactose transaminase